MKEKIRIQYATLEEERKGESAEKRRVLEENYTKFLNTQLEKVNSISRSLK